MKSAEHSEGWDQAIMNSEIKQITDPLALTLNQASQRSSSSAFL